MIRSVILCEGKHDAWFIDELLRNRGLNSLILKSIKDFREKLRVLVRGHSVSDNDIDVLILPLNSESKDKIYKDTSAMMGHFRELVRTFCGCKILLVVDSDGESERFIREKFYDSLGKTVVRFNPRPELEINANSNIYVKFKDCSICFYLFVVPNSLEIEIFKKLKSSGRYSSEIKKITAPKDGIYKICKSYFNCEQERLYRWAVKFFNDEGWVNCLLSLILEV